MRTFGSGNQTYLYLNGLAVNQPVRLCKNVELLPAKVDCHADLFLGLGKSDVDISVISLFLPFVQSQLRVQGSDAKETATRSWNALWDALLLGAITGTEVMCNLQSDISTQELKPDSKVIVTNYMLRGFPHKHTPSMSNSEIAWVEHHFEKARKLLDNDNFRNAVHCLASFSWHSMPRARLAIIWSGIEGLFGVDSEIVFRVSLYCARFLHPDDCNKQTTVFESVKDLYKSRSKAVHGGRMKGDPAISVKESAYLLKSLVLRCAEIDALPDPKNLVF